MSSRTSASFAVCGQFSDAQRSIPVDYRLINAAVAPGAGGDCLGEGAGFGGAVAKEFLDVVEIGGEFCAFGASGREVVPVVFEEGLLQIAVAETADAQAVFEIFGDAFRSHQLQELNGDVCVGVRFGFSRGAAVHD